MSPRASIIVAIIFTTLGAACAGPARDRRTPPPPAGIAAIPPAAVVDALAARRAAAVAALAERRAAAVAALHAYAVAGQYPTDDRGQPLSVFVDARGVRCPMAELVYRSGRADLVAAVQRERNDVRLRDVTAGPLHAWMQTSGLTPAEIDLVQGALVLDRAWLPVELSAPDTTVALRAQVRGKLEAIEAVLQRDTGASLTAAAALLPPGTTVAALAATPRTSPVLPPAP